MINIMSKITESAIEKFAIELLENSGYQYIYAPSIVPERKSFLRRAMFMKPFKEIRP